MRNSFLIFEISNLLKLGVWGLFKYLFGFLLTYNLDLTYNLENLICTKSFGDIITNFEILKFQFTQKVDIIA